MGTRARLAWARADSALKRGGMSHAGATLAAGQRRAGAAVDGAFSLLSQQPEGVTTKSPSPLRIRGSVPSGWSDRRCSAGCLRTTASGPCEGSGASPAGSSTASSTKRGLDRGVVDRPVRGQECLELRQQRLDLAASDLRTQQKVGGQEALARAYLPDMDVVQFRRREVRSHTLVDVHDVHVYRRVLEDGRQRLPAEARGAAQDQQRHHERSDGVHVRAHRRLCQQRGHLCCCGFCRFRDNSSQPPRIAPQTQRDKPLNHPVRRGTAIPCCGGTVRWPAS